MKKLFLFLAICFSINVSMHAQEAPRPTGNVRDEVGMTKEQYASYKQIREANKQSNVAIDSDATLDMTAKKAKKKEMNAERETAILNLLDEGQKQKYQDYMVRRKAEKKAAAAKPVEEGAQ